MTIKKLWLIVLIVISITAISINTLILSTLTDKHFIENLRTNYTERIEQIQKHSQRILSRDNISREQAAMEMRIYLRDPILRIEIQSIKGKLIADTEEFRPMGRNMRGMMGGGAPPQRPLEEKEKYDIKNDEGEQIGILLISKRGALKNSIIAEAFKEKLVKNSLLSMVVTLFISVIIGIYISKRMSQELTETADLANNIQVGEDKSLKKSTIIEINMIRESLEELNTRLKIRQKNRKELVDQLIHQTRTPLTILRSHLEGIEDGIIEMNPDEIEIWQNQIGNITAIVSNVSGMIDANKERDEIHMEEVEILPLISQIVKGIKPQFDKKGIELNISKAKKIKVKTDRYKLSQVIYNILTNAYKYTESGGKVEVDYGIEGHMLEISVSDTGKGIETDELEKIFRAYYRSTAAIGTSGDGIGLYVVKENLESINGEIGVESQKGEGSRFTIKLPFSEEV